MGSSDWIEETFLSRGQLSSGRTCSAGLCSLGPWRFTKPDWKKPWAVWSGLLIHHGFEPEVGLQNSQVPD